MTAREERAMRLALRKLYDRDPEAFVSVIGQCFPDGKFREYRLPPRDGKSRVDARTLTPLLADYRNANRLLGMTREAYLSRMARDGFHYGNRYFEGVWRSVEAIKSQLVKAERLYKTDPDFGADVDSWQETFAEERLGCLAWGEVTSESSP
jgi:hypothetical protein